MSLHDRALIEGLAALAADPAQGRGERRVAHPVADRGRLAARQHDLCGRRVLQFPLVAVPVPGDARGHAIAVFGGAGGGLEQFGERLGAVLAVERAPGVDRARHRHGMRGLRVRSGRSAARRYHSTVAALPARGRSRSARPAARPSSSTAQSNRRRSRCFAARRRIASRPPRSPHPSHCRRPAARRARPASPSAPRSRPCRWRRPRPNAREH